MGLISWFINKVTQDQIRELAILCQRLQLRQDHLEEQFKKTRAYVGYKPKSKQAANEEEMDEETIPVRGKFDKWLSKLPQEEQAFIAQCNPEDIERLKSMVNDGLI